MRPLYIKIPQEGPGELVAAYSRWPHTLGGKLKTRGWVSQGLLKSSGNLEESFGS